jgi:hypothetical protein
MDPTNDDNKGKKNNQDTRAVWFCLGMSKWRNNPARAILKELRNRHELTWLRMSMSYHKFSNLREIFQGDLNQKLMDGIISRDFMDRPCNCNRASKIDGKCAYNGECRKMHHRSAFFFILTKFYLKSIEFSVFSVLEF